MHGEAGSIDPISEEEMGFLLLMGSKKVLFL